METSKVTEQINEKFFEEYVSEDAVCKYTTNTAGFGINYLLRHDYASVYLSAVNSYLRTSPQRPLRLLEFGCGGGMNIIALVSLLQQRGNPCGICIRDRFLAASGGIGASRRPRKVYRPV